jgi:predicted nucleotidyltransferase/DNA-binding XRE family transcriptional regulator
MDRADDTAGSLLRQARVGAGMSQAELALSAGVAQSVISAYEAGRRQPSFPTLAKLIDAAGCDLVVNIQQQPPQLSRLSGPVGRQVRRKRRDLVAAAAAHGVTNLRVFGSVARGEDRPDSDVDLLVDLPPDIGLFGLGQVRAELEAILGTKIDLVSASDLKPAVRARAERDLVGLTLTQLGRDYAGVITSVMDELNRQVAARVGPAELAAADDKNGQFCT